MTCPLTVNPSGAVTHQAGVTAPDGSLMCEWCGKKLSGRQKRWCGRKCSNENTINHRWTNAKRAAKALATWFKCAECNDFFRVVEVDHIKPCKGDRGWSCAHHRANLRVLCIPCHKKKTDQDRKNGWE